MFFFPCKPHPFGNEYHTIDCVVSKVIYQNDIVKVKYRLRYTRKNYLDKKGVIVGLVVWKSNLIWFTGKVLVMDSGFYVLEGLVLIVRKGVFVLALIKKWRYWPKGVPEEEIIWHTQQK